MHENTMDAFGPELELVDAGDTQSVETPELSRKVRRHRKRSRSKTIAPRRLTKEEIRLSQTLSTPEVVVKRGAQPTLVRTADRSLQDVPTVAVPQVVDTTAAGDSFAGAYLAARLAGADAAAAAAAGNRLAARVVQHRGAVIPATAMADLT